MRIAVVGGGVIGHFVTRELLKRGAQVTVIDQFDLLHSHIRASSGSRAVTVLWQKSGIHLEIMKYGFQEWRKFYDDKLCGMRSVGLAELFPASSSKDVRNLASVLLENQQEFSIGSAGSIESLQNLPLSNDKESICIYRPDALLMLDVQQIMPHLWSELKTRINFLQTKVDSLDIRNEERAVLNTASGAMEFDKVILCTGAWVSRFMQSIGSPLTGCYASKQLYFCFDGLTANGYGIPAIRDYRSSEAHYLAYPAVDDQCFKVLEDNYGPESDDFVSERVDDNEERRVRSWATDSLGDTGQAHPATCHYAITPDGLPIVGERGPVVVVSEPPGSGVRSAPALGLMTAELIYKEYYSFELGVLSPERFS